MRTSLAFAILMVSASLAAAAPLNDADCEAVWKLVDVDKKGSINAEQAKAYVADFVQADVDKNGSIDATEFKAACKAGLVKKKYRVRLSCSFAGFAAPLPSMDFERPYTAAVSPCGGNVLPFVSASDPPSDNVTSHSKRCASAATASRLDGYKRPRSSALCSRGRVTDSLLVPPDLERRYHENESEHRQQDVAWHNTQQPASQICPGDRT